MLFVVSRWQKVLLKKPPFANAVSAVTVIGAFLALASITISPQFVVKVKLLFLNGGLTSGGVMFFTECALALVFLQFTSAIFFEGDALEVGERIIEKIVIKNVMVMSFIIIFTRRV
jgi:hypothetical protein